jgi:hypothetical protein
MNPKPIDDPDLTIAGLKIWVHGRQFPESGDYHDANWLFITAQCDAEGARVTATGPILQITEILHFLKSCEILATTLRGSAILPCREPNLAVELDAKSHGHIAITVEITPEHLSQWHRFEFDADQTYLPPIISGCRNLLKRFPIRGNTDDNSKEKG